MYRLVIPRSLFTQLALLDEGTEGLFTCEETTRLRYVVQSITRGADWYTNAHVMSQKGSATIFGSYRVVSHMEGTNSRKDLAATLASHVHCSWVLSQLSSHRDLPQSPVQFSLVIMKRVRHHIYSTVFAGYVLHSLPRDISDDTATILRRHPVLTGHVTRVNSDELIDLNAEIDEVSKPEQTLPEFTLPNQEVSELLLELEARLRNHVIECKLVNDTGLSLHESLERQFDDINYSDEDFTLIGEFPSPASRGDHVLVNPYDMARNNSVASLCDEHDAEIERLKSAIDTIEEENALLVREYREIYKHVQFLKVADHVLLPHLDVTQPQAEQRQSNDKSRDEFASYGSPIIPDHSHVSASRDEEFDMQDMDEDMRRAIELSKFDQ